MVDFDEALLDACPVAVRGEVLTEAAMLADALPVKDRVQQLEAIAQALSLGRRDGALDRVHARRLAAALRRLAHAA